MGALGGIRSCKLKCDTAYAVGVAAAGGAILRKQLLEDMPT